MKSPHTTYYTGQSVFIREEHIIQFGVSPGGTLLIPLPDTVSARRVHQVFKDMRKPESAQHCVQQLQECGLNAQDAWGIVEELIQTEQLIAVYTPRPIVVVGNTRSAKLLTDKLKKLFPNVRRAKSISSAQVSEHELLVWSTSEHLSAQETIDLLTREIPHMWCGILPSRGFVSQLVVPGKTSCLYCLDLHLRASDPQWDQFNFTTGSYNKNFTGEDLFTSTAATLIQYYVRYYDDFSDPVLQAQGIERCIEDNNEALIRPEHSHSSFYTTLNTLSGTSIQRLVPAHSECFCCLYAQRNHIHRERKRRANAHRSSVT